jgi:hypothetical protein
MSHWQSRLVGERDDLFDGIQPTLIAEVLEHGSAPKVGLLALAHAPGKHPLGQRTPYQGAHPVALGDRQHLGFDATTQN